MLPTSQGSAHYPVARKSNLPVLSVTRETNIEMVRFRIITTLSAHHHRHAYLMMQATIGGGSVAHFYCLRTTSIILHSFREPSWPESAKSYAIHGYEKRKHKPSDLVRKTSCDLPSRHITPPADCTFLPDENMLYHGMRSQAQPQKGVSHVC